MINFRRRNWMKTRNKKKVFAGKWSDFFPKSGKDQKKGLRRKLKSFYPEIRWKPQKRSSREIEVFSPQFATIFGRKFAGSFSTGWLFFLWSSSAQLLMGERLTLDGRMLNLNGGMLTLDGGTRPPRPGFQLRPNSIPVVMVQPNKRLANRTPKTTLRWCD